MSDLTIIIPIFNEVAGIPRLAKSFDPYFSATQLKAEVLLVNDGSTDGSLEEIQKLCQANPKFKYISLEKNAGLSAALYAGIQFVNSRWVGYIDGDLQTDPEDFLKLEEFIHEFQLVTGFRADRKDTIVKKITSKVANGFRNWMLKDGIQDSGCPLKIMQSDLAKSLPPFKGMHRFFPALIQIKGGLVKEIPVRHYPRETGQSKFGFGNRFWGPIFDTFGVRWMKKRELSLKINTKLGSARQVNS